MIKAKAEMDGREIVILGLAEENVKRLRQGDPIRIKKEEMGIPFDIYIFWGEDHRALLGTIKPMVGADTQMRIGTLHGSKT